jgi:predicted RNA-binding Zn-ribbon protein involved in translation (DUF1610 family)
MTTIRTTCPQCGEVDMTPESILLSIRDRSGEGSYSFSCPTCLHTIEKPADRKVAALLLSAGVEVADEAHTDVYADPELPGFEAEQNIEPLEQRPGGPPLTFDDLIEFHFLLNDEDAFYRAIPHS